MRTLDQRRRRGRDPGPERVAQLVEGDVVDRSTVERLLEAADERSSGRAACRARDFGYWGRGGRRFKSCPPKATGVTRHWPSNRASRRKSQRADERARPASPRL